MDALVLVEVVPSPKSQSYATQPIDVFVNVSTSG